MSNAALPRSCPIGRENPKRARRSNRLNDLWYLKAVRPVRQRRRPWHHIAPVDPPDRSVGAADRDGMVEPRRIELLTS